MTSPLTYNDLTRRHFESAAYAGVLTGAGTRRGTAGSRTEGTWVQFDAQFDQPPGGWARRAGGRADTAGGPLGTACMPLGTACVPPRLRAVRFQAFGCPHVIAVADWIAQQAVGLAAGGGLPESITALKARFAIPTEKLGRLLVIEDAWIAAVSPPSMQDVKGSEGRPFDAW